MEENLVLTNYGVTLRRLTHDKIEMVRQWRNDYKIASTMFYQQEITPKMQERWFANLDINRNFYFIVCYKDEEIGLINVKNIDFEKKNGESGVFIYEDKYLGTDVAYRAHLVMFDYVYQELHLAYTYSHMREDNPKATRFAQFLGGRISAVHPEQNTVECVLTAEEYMNNKNRLRFIQKWEKINNNI